MPTFTLELPTKDLPNYTYTTDLDGKEYKVNFRYWTNTSSWYISLFDISGNLLLGGHRLTPWINILSPYTRELLPQGGIVLLPNKLEDYPSSPTVTLDNLNKDFKLYYYAP